jgi:hypothetical protein
VHNEHDHYSKLRNIKICNTSTWVISMLGILTQQQGIIFEGKEKEKGEHDKRTIREDAIQFGRFCESEIVARTIEEVGLPFEDRTRTCNDPDFISKEIGACIEVKYRSDSLFIENEWRAFFEKMQKYEKKNLILFHWNWPYLEHCRALAKEYKIKVCVIEVVPLALQECEEKREAYSLIRLETLKILKDIAMDLGLAKIWKRIFKLVNRLIAKSGPPSKNTASTRFPTGATADQGKRIVGLISFVHEVTRMLDEECENKAWNTCAEEIFGYLGTKNWGLMLTFGSSLRSSFSRWLWRFKE